MESTVADVVVDFYYAIFGHIFTSRFSPEIEDRLKRDDMRREIERCAGAASRSLTRFFANEQMNAGDVTNVLEKLKPVCDHIELAAISNPHVVPESLLAELEHYTGC